MSGFNDFKNNTQILKKYLLKMNVVSQCDIKPQWIEENFLKENNPHIFLQILHYVLIKFSPFVLFVKILDFYPTIKDDSDKKFVTNVMVLSRKMFQIDAKIDIEQFLSSKFVQKKTQFISVLSKAAYDYHLKESKSPTSIVNGKGNKKQNELASYIPSKLDHKYANDDNQEDEKPRNLNIAPSNTRRPIINKQDMQDSSSDQDFKQLINKKKQLNKMKQKPVASKIMSSKQKDQQIYVKNYKKKGNVFPKSIQKGQDSSNQFYQTEKNLIQNKNRLSKNQKLYSNNQQEPESHKSYQQPIKSKPSQNKSHNLAKVQQFSYVQHQQQPKQYVSRQEFMQIITGMTVNFTELMTKFNQFQSQVGNWVQNVNAKISILQENVKTIKNNL